MKDYQNVSVEAQFDILLQLSENATALHKSLMPLIPSDEQRQNAWFASITEYNQEFINDAKEWISEVSRPRSELNHDVEHHQEVLLRGQRQPSSQNDDQDDILSCDSVSNLSSRKQGSKSNVSTTSSARR